MSDTPRTDAEFIKPWTASRFMEIQQFARTLERELTADRVKVALLREALLAELKEGA